MVDAAAEQRFHRLYDVHHRAVLSYMARRVERDSAYDATEDVFVIAWRRLDSIPDGEMDEPVRVHRRLLCLSPAVSTGLV